MDNEVSAALIKEMQSRHVDFQLVPPHMHRRNKAERAIRTFKDHLITGLCAADPDFPMHLWDRLLPQAVLTLNLLRTSNLNPRLSAQEHLNGIFDFNRTPLAPPGTKIIIHEKPSQRPTWAPHGTDGWYIGPALNHYRCHRTYTTKTGGERISDTVHFCPKRIQMPTTDSVNQIYQSAKDLTMALQNPMPATPFLNFGDATLNALKKLADIFDKSATQAKEEDTPPPRVQHTAPPRVETQTNNQKEKPNQKEFTGKSHDAPPPKHRYNTRNQPNANLCYEYPVMFPVIDPNTGATLEYKDLIKGPTKQTWQKSMANELGRLAQGVGERMPTGTDTIFFIPKSEVPSHKTATYARIVSEIRPQKQNQNECKSP